EAGATIRLYANGTEIASGTADGVGNWSITSSVLGEGTYTITARAEDVAGNLSGVSSSLSVTIDTTGPTVSLLGLSDMALVAGETSLVTITFNEAVAGFTNFDLTIAN